MDSLSKACGAWIWMLTASLENNYFCGVFKFSLCQSSARRLAISGVVTINDFLLKTNGDFILQTTCRNFFITLTKLRLIEIFRSNYSGQLIFNYRIKKTTYFWTRQMKVSNHINHISPNTYPVFILPGTFVVSPAPGCW